MGKLCNFGVRLGILGLPFFYWSQHFSPYEVPKTWLVITLALISCVGAVISSRQVVETTRINRPLAIMVLGLLVWLLVSSVVAQDYWQSWWGNSYRHDGLLTLLAMVVLGLTLPMESKIVKLVAYGNLGLSLWMIGRGEMEAALTLGNPNMLAGFLAITLPSLQVWGKAGYIGIVIALVALWMTGSWGGILVGGSWLLFILLKSRPKILAFALLVTLVGVGWLYNREYETRAVPGYIVAEARSRILTKASIAISQKPILGWGWAQFDQAFASIDYPTHYLVDAYVDRTHASILEYGVAGGMPALILYIGIIGVTSKILLASKSPTDRTLGAIIILYILLSQTNVTTVAVDWLLWLGIGRAMRAT